MKKILFATDLDRTMIYSSKFLNDHVCSLVACVESDGTKEISFMLTEAIEMRALLSEMLYFVPVTTRAKHLYDRVHLFRDAPFAIIENGATILKGGTILGVWESHIQCYLKAGDFHTKLEGMAQLLLASELTLPNTVQWIGDKFIMCKTDFTQEMDQYLLAVLDHESFNFTIQGKKVYIIPKKITKENALHFLENYLETNYTIAAGDGKLDYGMLIHGDVAYLPGDASLLDESDIHQQKGITISKYKSFHGTLDILQQVHQRVLSLLTV